MGFTPKEVIDRDWEKLKKAQGLKWAINYFAIMDKLRNPNYYNIVEYRYAGVVTEDCGCYHFHAIMGLKWKKNNYIAFVIDITHQYK